MGDRLAVMADGAFEQVGAPEEVFHRPSSRFVARFMGRTDFLPGEVTEGGVQTEIGFLAQPLPLPAGTPVEVAFREDDVALRPDPAGQSLVLARQFRGAMNVYRVRLPSGNLIHACQPHTRILAPGSTVEVRAEPGHALACFHEGRAVPLPAE